MTNETRLSSAAEVHSSRQLGPVAENALSVQSSHHLQAGTTDRPVDPTPASTTASHITLLPCTLGSLVVTALDSQLNGCEFNSRPLHCRVTTSGKLFTSMCLCSLQSPSGSKQAWLQCERPWVVVFVTTATAIYSLDTGCTPLLQSLSRLSLPPSVRSLNEYQLSG